MAMVRAPRVHADALPFAPSAPAALGASGADLPRLQGLAPVVGPGAKLLVLGSFPGVASLTAQQYYAHPRNQFWPILSALWGLQGDDALSALPYAARLPMVQARGLAIWDVYAGCVREGSLDSAIRNAVPNDIAALHSLPPR